MRQRVAIVTDSTASIPADVASKLHLPVVQLELRIGDEHNDERRIPHAQLAEAMVAGVPVETSEPPSPAFFWNYMDAAAAGVEAIISVHISEQLSRACKSARSAAAEVDLPVYVVDSRLVGLSLGFSAVAAAEAAASGATPQQVMNVLEQRLRSTTQLVYVDTLEYLRRGGRINNLQAMLGQALSIAPADPQARELEVRAGHGQSRRSTRSSTPGSAGPATTGRHRRGALQAADRAEQVLTELRKRIPQVRRAVLVRPTRSWAPTSAPAHSGDRLPGELTNRPRAEANPARASRRACPSPGGSA